MLRSAEYTDRGVRFILRKNIFGREDFMPVYQFFCAKHGLFEKIAIKAEWDDIRCPKCGAKAQKDQKMQFSAKKPAEKFLSLAQ
jgi:putative FmdB family regulatory protein